MAWQMAGGRLEAGPHPMQGRLDVAGGLNRRAPRAGNQEPSKLPKRHADCEIYRIYRGEPSALHPALEAGGGRAGDLGFGV